MTFAMTTSLLNVVDWTRGNMCVWVAFDHRRLPFASLWKSSFRPPLLIALALISSRLPLKSPLHLMLIAFVPCRHRFMNLRLSHRPWFHQTLAFNERLQWSWVTVAVRQNASEWSTFGWSPINDKDTLLEVPVSYVWTSREPGAVSVNKVLFTNGCPNWALQRGVLAPYANQFASLKSPPHVVDLFWLHHMNALASAVPFSSENGVATTASPQGEWLSPTKGFPYWGIPFC